MWQLVRLMVCVYHGYYAPYISHRHTASIFTAHLCLGTLKNDTIAPLSVVTYNVCDDRAGTRSCEQRPPQHGNTCDRPSLGPSPNVNMATGAWPWRSPHEWMWILHFCTNENHKGVSYNLILNQMAPIPPPGTWANRVKSNAPHVVQNRPALDSPWPHGRGSALWDLIDALRSDFSSVQPSAL